MAIAINSFFYGINIANLFLVGRKVEREIDQGGYLSGANSEGKLLQLTAIYTLAKRLISTISSPLIAARITLVTDYSYLLSTIAIVFATIHKTTTLTPLSRPRSERSSPDLGPDDRLAVWTNQLFLNSLKGSNGRVISAFEFLSNHSENISRVALIVGTVALLWLGQIGCAIGIISGVAYEYADHKLGIVPSRVRWCVEKTLPFALTLYRLNTPFWTDKLVVIMDLLSLTSKGINYIQGGFDRGLRWGIGKVDSYFGNRFQRLSEYHKTPFIDDLDRPLVKLTHLDPTTTQKILLGKQRTEIDYGHCSKAVSETTPLPRDRNFKQLLSHFSSIDWDSEYAVIFKKCQDDDRCLIMVAESLSLEVNEQNKALIKGSFESYLQKIDPNTKKFLLNWYQDQMKGLVRILLEEDPIAGSIDYLAQAQDDCAIILAFLNSLDQHRDTLEFKDILMNLAIECGRYCGLGLTEASSKLVERVRTQTSPAEPSDPYAKLEINIYRSLLNLRKGILGGYIERLMRDPELNLVGSDIHRQQHLKTTKGLGFYPVPPHERQLVDPFDIWAAKYFSPFTLRKYLYRPYEEQYDQSVRSATKPLEIFYYIQAWAQQNTLLSDGDRDQITHLFSNGQIHDVDARKLALVILGVLKLTPSTPS